MGGRTSIPLSELIAFSGYPFVTCEVDLQDLSQQTLLRTEGDVGKISCHDRLREKVPVLMRTFRGYSERESWSSVLEFAQRLWCGLQDFLVINF